jgi:lipid II:glycine glycyltransferase (peptidoglycan interpeptide bridge formation enzyme)
VECRGGLPLFGDASPSVSFLGHRLELRGGETALFSRCEGSTRRAVRRAEQSGLTIEFSRDLEAVRAFHGLLCKTRRRHGVPPQPFGFFAGIQSHVLAQKQGWVVLARSGQVPVAGAVYFSFGKTAIYKFGASDEKFQHLRANNLVMWEAIKHHAREGFEILEFGRTSLTNHGLQKFKLSWGTTEYRIDYVRHDLRTGGFAVVGDAASGLHTRVMGLLPAPVFKLVGSALYKHMA